MPWRGPEYPGELPTLGYQILDWFSEYLIVPDGPLAGEPLVLTDEQAMFVLKLYAVDPKFDGNPVRGAALVNGRRVRRAILSRPKGWGKSPLLAAIALAEALADVVPDGWDADGEPVGRPWTSLGFKAKVQLVAVSEDQTANTWDPLLDMARGGPVRDAYDIEPMQTFVSVPRGTIEYVTASGTSREGFRPVFSVLDQALALDTPIPTPAGWTTMGALSADDLVFGSSGEPVKVVEAKPASTDHDCYRVTFTDGTSLVASAGHLWWSKLRASGAKPKIRTTQEMVEDPKGRTFRIPVAPAQDSPTVDLPVPPYLLGLWLGDGTRAKCEISVCEADLADVQAALALDGVESWPRRYAPTGRGYSPGTANVNLTFSRGSGYQGENRPAVAKALQALPCYRDKHVPPEYLGGSIAQRTALLQGLMDSDGCATTLGTCTFVSTKECLADAVVYLLRSLGQVTSGAKRVVDDRYTGGVKLRVDFTPRNGFQPFRLPRKANRVRQHSRGHAWITITKIESVERVPVRCIAVDSDDHLFAVGVGGHLTHNTESWTPTNGGLKLAATIRRNLAKVNGCSVESPNAYLPGEGSVAEKSHEAWKLQSEGKLRGAVGGILLDHREAPPETDPAERESLVAGLRVAYGDSADANGGWVNLDRIVEDYWDPATEPQDARRFYLNQVTHSSDSWLSQPEWAARSRADIVVGDREMITLGFDGSRARKRGVTDATALVGCRVSDGHIFQIEVWEQPDNIPAGEEWRVPTEQVDAKVRETFTKYTVVGMYADPAKWETYVASWEAKYGAALQVKATRSNPIEWWTNRATQMVQALESFHSAVVDGEMTHDGASTLARHVLNARRRIARTGVTIAKDHPDSPRKIDAAVAAVLAWQARLDAVAAGVTPPARSYVAKRLR